MVREASSADLPRIVDLGSQSLKDGPYAGIIRDVPEQARKCAEHVLQHGKILLAEENGELVGVLGIIFANHHFSGQPYAAELIWYMPPDKRDGFTSIMLMRAAERLAKENGMGSILFTAPNDYVSKMYEIAGYKKLETTYIKRF